MFGQAAILFQNRHEAASRLAQKLIAYKGRRPLVLAIPRGAVLMAKAIADELDGEVDVVLVRKLRAPGNPEFAIGSVAETGWAFIADYVAMTGASDAYIEAEKRSQLETIRQRRAEYTPVRPPIDPKGRIVIVIDDGLATGSTMISALHSLRARQPAKLICAVPVSPPETLKKVAKYADEVVCLETPDDFFAVGQYYREFPQVGDDEVIAVLRQGPGTRG